MKQVLQDWVTDLPLMQQSVLLSAVRGPDGIAKGHRCKSLIRWYRRCTLISAFDGKALNDPLAQGGGSFTGPVFNDYELSAVRSILSDPLCSDIERTVTDEEIMKYVADEFLKSRDELPFHYFTHFMHAAEIIGYKHSNMEIRKWWYSVYERMVHALHLFPETEEQMDKRLGDNFDGWMARSDEAGSCST